MSNVVVTGCNSGIGLETAIALAKAGHNVFATMRNPAKGAALRERIAAEKLPISIVALDVDSDDSVTQAFSEIRSRAGFIEVLVNNAGIDRFGPVEELPFDDFRASMETNYFGALRCIRACLSEMRERRRGSIVNVSSIAGRLASSPMAAYTATKFALEALSEALAQEVKPFNIRVLIVEPGVIDTPMGRRAAESTVKSHYPQTERIANLFAASLTTPTPPTLVAEKIRDVIDTGTWRLRHPVGPDAQGFLAYRASMSDEEWINWGAVDDDAWYARVQRDFGLDARPKVARRTA